MPTRAPGAAAIAIQLPPDELQNLFDALPNVVFFIKDRECRYTHVNATLLQRLGLKQRGDLVGRTSLQVFPSRLGETYLLQDQRALQGEVIEDQLELHLYPNRAAGWCLTFKRPLYDGGRVAGVIGISRDLGLPDRQHSSFNRVESALKHMRANYGAPLRVQALAEIAGVSVAQLERQFKRVFQLTPQQLLTKLRIEEAMRLLRTGASIADIGQSCGFSDQSAFSRQFKMVVGMPPKEYRALLMRSH